MKYQWRLGFYIKFSGYLVRSGIGMTKDVRAWRAKGLPRLFPILFLYEQVALFLMWWGEQLLVYAHNSYLKVGSAS